MRNATASSSKVNPPTEQSSSQPAPGFGQTLELTFACPKCKHGCKALWGSLGQVMQCPACNYRFGIGRNGRFRRFRRAPRLRFTCPRCRRPGSLSASAVAGGVECAACQLQLFAGPNDRLYSADELQEVRRQSLADARTKPTSLYSDPARASLPLGAKVTIACVCALAAISALAAVSGLSPATPEAVAEQFTRQCLAAAWEETSEYVAQDDFQQMEFRRWRTMHFSSIRDKFRPAGDKARIEVVAVRTNPTEVLLKVTMTSEFLGVRSHVQCWRRHDDTTWLLDSVQTLSARIE